MDSQDSQPISKPKSSNLSDWVNSPEGKAAFKAEIERQEAMPSKAFPEPESKLDTLGDWMRSPEAKARLMEQIKRQNEAPSKAFPTDSQEA